ncbi:MAG: SPOR domain-containing protein [Algicola sp.]|nr:SPOR domain-containing protein [Algicola sp.]
MRQLNNYRNALLILACISTSALCAQSGDLVINQDEKIETLIELKKALNTSENASKRYKIQIFSGNRSSAEAAKSKFSTELPNWTSKMVYETPNYKVWVGSFRTRLEADRALVKIHKEFPTAFIFKPKIKE